MTDTPESELRIPRKYFYVLLWLIPIIAFPYTVATHNSVLIKTVLSHVIVGSVALYLVAGSMRRGELNLLRSEALLPMALFLSLGIISAALAPYRYAALEELARMITNFLIFMLALNVITTWKRRQRIAGMFLVVVGLTSYYGIMQTLGFDFVEWPPWFKAVATFGNPNFFAAFLLLCLPLLVVFFIQTESRFSKGLMLIPIGAGVACLLITRARASWVGAIVAGFFLVVALGVFIKEKSTRRWAIGLGSVSILAIAIAIASFGELRTRAANLLNPEHGTAQARLSIWSGTLDMAKEKPIFGWGVGHYFIHFPAYRPINYHENRNIGDITLHAHNEYLEVLAELGMVGLGIFLWVLWSILWPGVKALRNSEVPVQERVFLAGLLAGCLGFLVSNLFSVNMRWNSNGPFFWLMAGAACGIVSTYTRNTAHDRLLRIRFPRMFRASAIYYPAATAALMVSGIFAAYGYRMFRADLHYETAEDHYEAAKEFGPNHDRYQLVMDVAEDQTRKAVQLNPHSYRGNYQLGNILNAREKVREALKYYRIASQLAPDYSYLHSQYAEAYVKVADRFGESGDRAAKIRALNKAVARYDRAYELNDSRKMFINAHLVKALVHKELGEEEKAVELLTKLIKKTPDHVASRFHLAGIHARHGNWEEALPLYDSISLLEPLNELAYFYAGEVCLKANKGVEAIPILEKGRDQIPGSVNVRLALAKAYLQNQASEKARPELIWILQHASQTKQAKEAGSLLYRISS